MAKRHSGKKLKVMGAHIGKEHTSKRGYRKHSGKKK
jgi:hypothetical protein